MKDSSDKLARSASLAAKGAVLLQRRLKRAQENLAERVRGIQEAYKKGLATQPVTPLAMWTSGYEYALDFAQRTVLFWDTLRQRGNNFVEHERAGKPPLLHFEFETVLDGCTLDRPVNYALVRIVPPAGVNVDAKRRPYVVIDPRAGHGPGIGGFKDDSQVGVALREGHPVYFVIFHPEPEPGQTLLDVCAAEQAFVRRVRELHPESPKPVIIGNCQGGWAAMMLAASSSEDTGPIVINGAPMSYWGGAWQEGEGDNPMRYAGGLLGGTWLSTFISDLNNGRFDGAWLVQNFENLHPANTFWDKYYHVFANVDTEPPRFLEFERWWGGFYLMNREEIEWITRNLFVGNKLWSGEVSSASREAFDLRRIKSPIILFASMGDNITPPQQAFNWVADVYGSTEEIKARGQVIVGLLHQDVGHLGIFVSGKVAKKEHAQIVSVLKSIEALPAGLYGMKIHEDKGAKGKVEYRVEFVEHRLEDIVQRLNRFQRADEKPFEAVAAVSEFNQRAYELFAQPLVQAGSNAFGAKLQEAFHPLRFQRWAISDLNPWLAWLGPAAAAVKAQRQALGPDAPARKAERAMSEINSAALDYYREVRDAMSEAAFFQIYGNLFSLYLADKEESREREGSALVEPRGLPVVKEALAAMEEGGYPEAVARVAALLAHRGEPMPLERLHLRRELIEDYRELLPPVTPEEQRRIRGEQDIVVRYELDRAIQTLPRLLRNPEDRKRLLTLFDRLLADERFQNLKPTSGQTAMFDRINAVLGVDAPAARRLAAVKPLRAT
jgi:pimeloyl-ACP methyl ester carboxylesterase